MHIRPERDHLVAEGTVYNHPITNALPNGDTQSENVEFVGTMDFRQI
jgi:hypothetical protein